jgi:2-polyprenyl-3-methyl-5-hydroxy-6-metoxy-1,4-benzoquinol methylase
MIAQLTTTPRPHQKLRTNQESNRNDEILPYFLHKRGDILELTPADSKWVLSVGCGAAVTEGELVARGMQVVGIELNPSAAAQARSRGVTVIEGDAVALGAALERYTFDCLIYADVLEHLTDPVAVMRQQVPRLRPGGTVIISVPNFRWLRVFWQLFVHGKIQYTDAGVMDRTHLRITTRKMVLDWFTEVGIEFQQCQYNRGGRFARFTWRFLPSIIKEFISPQVVLVGKKPAR